MRKLIPQVFLLLAVALPTLASDLYPTPTNWSLGGLASISQRLIASGTILPPVASAAVGELFLLTSSDPHVLHRRGASGWVQVGGSGASGDTLTLGTGTADAQIYRAGTATVALASYVALVPMTATPSYLATGVLWLDGSASLRIYDGAQWLRLLATTTP